MPSNAVNKREQLTEAFKTSEILILDGAMGTMIQEYKLEEQDYRVSKLHRMILT